MKTNQKQKNIPHEWKEILVDDTCSRITNGFVGRATDFYTEDPGGVTYIQGFNVLRNDFKLTNIKKVTQEFHIKNSKSCLKEGDVLIVQTGDVGLTTIVPKSLEGSNCHALIINRFKRNIINPWYMSQFYNSPIGRNKLKRIETGSTMKHINVGDLKKLKLVLPPLPEQNRIVSVLETWDSGIEKLKQKIAIKKEIKKGLMQELLTGKKRLPGFDDKWELVKLGNLGNCLRGVSYKPKTDLVENDELNTYRLLRSNNVKNDSINIDDIQIVVGEKVKKSQVMIDGDILICTANGSKRLVGKSGIYRSFDNHNYTFGAFMGLFRFNKDIDKDLASYLFKSSKYKFYISNLLSGSSINNLKPSDIESMQFNFPKNIEEQKVIASILITADEEINILSEKLKYWQEQKKYLLNNLVTGQIRTPENLLEINN